MRNLKYAILGLLTRQDMTGYDILKAFQSKLGNFWHATHSQIYPELRRLTGEGLVEYSAVANGEVEKKLYTITDAGRRDFMAWMAVQDELEPTPKDIFRLKSYYLDGWTPEQALAQFTHQLAQRQAKLDNLRAMLETVYAHRAPGALSPPELGDYLVLKGAVMRETTNVQWLAETIELLKTLQKK